MGQSPTLALGGQYQSLVPALGGKCHPVPTQAAFPHTGCVNRQGRDRSETRPSPAAVKAALRNV